MDVTREQWEPILDVLATADPSAITGARYWVAKRRAREAGDLGRRDLLRRVRREAWAAYDRRYFA